MTSSVPDDDRAAKAGPAFASVIRGARAANFAGPLALLDHSVVGHCGTQPLSASESRRKFQKIAKVKI
jgi:hypothetical protein